MNIGIVTTWFERGAAYVSRAYLETLSKKHKIFIYARGGEKYAIGDPAWDEEYVTWGKVVPNKALMYIDLNDFVKWIQKNKIESVIFNEQRSWEIITKVKKLNITLGAYVDYYTPETVPFFWLYDYLICNTKRHYSVFKDHPSAVYIPWGTDIKAYKPDTVDHGDTLTFFHSCGLSPYRKGTDLVIRAFQKVKGNAKLVVHSQDGFKVDPDTNSIMLKDKRIELIIREVGKPGLYYFGDVYVYPSRLEGIGLTIAEALASGLPVITTNNPPMNEFIINDVNGKLVDVDKHQYRYDNYYWPESICNIESLAKAMQYYVDHVDEIGLYKYNARKFAEENLDWEKNSSDLSNIIERFQHNEKMDKKLIKTVSRYETSQYGKFAIIKQHTNIIAYYSWIRSRLLHRVSQK